MDMMEKRYGKRHVKAAAILYQGKAYEGRSHAEIGWKMLDDGICPRPFPGCEAQAFVLDDGRFVSRAEAMYWAIEAGQVDPEKTCNTRDLYSEDLIDSELWDYPLKNQRYVKKKD